MQFVTCTVPEQRSALGYAVSVTPSRRDRQQAALRLDVLAAAVAQIEDHGPAGLNWRAIARDVGVAPSTLYTYFDGVDGLTTAVLVAAYDDMAAAIAQAAGDPTVEPRQRIHAAAQAYRSWALANPARFNLLFTDVVTGYAAPEGGPTVAAQVALLAPLATALAEAAGVDGGGAIEDWPAPLRRQGLGLWGQLHGLVSLEVNHHLDWMDHDERAAVHVAAIESCLDAAAVR